MTIEGLSSIIFIIGLVFSGAEIMIREWFYGNTSYIGFTIYNVLMTILRVPITDTYFSLIFSTIFALRGIFIFLMVFIVKKRTIK